MTAKFNLLTLLIALCISLPGKAATLPRCIHFWIHDTQLVPSGKTVGIDVGQSPYGTSGIYKCSMQITAEDIFERPYLFIGEVGNESYFRVTKINEDVKDILVTHGLDPEYRQKAVYTRYLPFIIPIKGFFSTPGTYEFEIVYDAPGHLGAGLRSGLPTLLNLPGVIKSSIFHSPTLSFHVLQFFFLLACFLGFILWSGIEVKRRIWLSAACLSSAAVVLQVSAIPRSFLEPTIGLKINFIAQFVALPLLGQAFLQFYRFNKDFEARSLLILQVGFAVISSALVIKCDAGNQFYTPFVGLALFFLAPVQMGYLATSIWKGSLRPTYKINEGKSLPVYLFLASLLYCFDLINFTALHSRFYFLNHFLLYSSGVIILRRMALAEATNENIFRRKLEDIRVTTLKEMSKTERVFIDDINNYIEKLSNLIQAKRVSVIEYYGDTFKFIGTNRIAKDATVDIPLHKSEVLKKLRETQEIQEGHIANSDFLVFPIRQNQITRAAVSMTNFLHKSVAPFLRDKMDTIHNECEILINLMITQRDSDAQKKLLQMIRMRTHALQAESEEFFLKNFDLSTQSNENAFILGDVVDSTALNERFGGNVIEKIVDEHLTLVWKQFRHLGIVLNRTKGDAVSILVPNLTTDSEGSDATHRCYQVLEFLANSEERLHAISKGHGVAFKVNYRFAMNKSAAGVVNKLAPETLKSMNLLVDKEIDGAARAISNIALPGECLVLESAAQHLSNIKNLIKLPEQRVKGKGQGLNVYTVTPLQKLGT